VLKRKTMISFLTIKTKQAQYIGHMMREKIIIVTLKIDGKTQRMVGNKSIRSSVNTVWKEHNKGYKLKVMCGLVGHDCLTMPGTNITHCRRSVHS